MSSIFLLFCFCKSKVENFHFTSIAFFVQEKFKFENFRILSFMTPSNAKTWIKKYTLPNNVGNKQILAILPVCQRILQIYMAWKLVSSSFLFVKKHTQSLLENEIFETCKLHGICNYQNMSKSIMQTFPDSPTEDSLKIKTCQISVTDCVYFPNISVRCIFCFVLLHVMTSWNFKF